MKNIVSVCLLLLSTGCYAEWDIPKSPRKDPCTGVVENKIVYVNPTCRYPTPPQHPAVMVQ